jgi:hypothetical protein
MRSGGLGYKIKSPYGCGRNSAIWGDELNEYDIEKAHRSVEWAKVKEIWF